MAHILERNDNAATANGMESFKPNNKFSKIILVCKFQKFSNYGKEIHFSRLRKKTSYRSVLYVFFLQTSRVT